MPKGWEMLQGDEGPTDMRSAQTARNGTCRGTQGNVKGGEKKTTLATFAEKPTFSFWWLTPSTKNHLLFTRYKKSHVQKILLCSWHSAIQTQTQKAAHFTAKAQRFTNAATLSYFKF